MKIKINNWNEFETRNATYFIRDINMKNELNVYACYIKNKKKYFLVYIDFIKYKLLLWIKDGEYFEITDQNFSNEYVKVSKYISKYQNDVSNNNGYFNFEWLYMKSGKNILTVNGACQITISGAYPRKVGVN